MWPWNSLAALLHREGSSQWFSGVYHQSIKVATSGSHAFCLPVFYKEVGRRMMEWKKDFWVSVVWWTWPEMILNILVPQATSGTQRSWTMTSNASMRSWWQPTTVDKSLLLRTPWCRWTWSQFASLAGKVGLVFISPVVWRQHGLLYRMCWLCPQIITVCN
jgi:hypothetical protein